MLLEKRGRAAELRAFRDFPVTDKDPLSRETTSPCGRGTKYNNKIRALMNEPSGENTLNLFTLSTFAKSFHLTWMYTYFGSRPTIARIDAFLFLIRAQCILKK